MKLNKTKNGYTLETSKEDMSHIWIVLNEYRQYRLTATEGEREMATLFLNLLNGVSEPTKHLQERALHLAKLRSEHYYNR